MVGSVDRLAPTGAGLERADESPPGTALRTGEGLAALARVGVELRALEAAEEGGR
jgi:hypothetical protein